jgi:hypothetical protein
VKGRNISAAGPIEYALCSGSIRRAVSRNLDGGKQSGRSCLAGPRWHEAVARDGPCYDGKELYGIGVATIGARDSEADSEWSHSCLHNAASAMICW